MKTTAWIVGATAAAALLSLAPAASAAAASASKPETGSCFFTRSWDGWHAPSDNVLYLRVNLRDIYQVDLSAGSSRLTWPDARLISRDRIGSVCSALDLDLSVSDSSGGFPTPIIAKSIHKLTPVEVAAIPKKDLP